MNNNNYPGNNGNNGGNRYKMVGIGLIVIAGVLFFSSMQSGRFNPSNFFGSKKLIEHISESTGKFDGDTHIASEKLTGIDNIKINSVSEDIDILVTDTSEIIAKFYGATNGDKEPKMIVEKQGSTLTIRIEHPTVLGFNFTTRNQRLEINLPREYGDAFSVKSVSGEIKIEPIKVSELDLQTVSGNIQMTALKAIDVTVNTTSGDISGSVEGEKLYVKTVSGSFQGKNIEVEKLEINSISGNCNIEGLISEINFSSVSGALNLASETLNLDVNAKTTSGEVKIYMPKNSNFGFDYDTLSGSFDCDFKYVTTDNNKSNNSIEGHVGDKGSEIKVKTVSGGLRINQN